MQTYLHACMHARTHKINAEVLIGEEKCGGSVLLWGHLLAWYCKSMQKYSDWSFFPTMKHLYLTGSRLLQNDSVPIDRAWGLTGWLDEDENAENPMLWLLQLLYQNTNDGISFGKMVVYTCRINTKGHWNYSFVLRWPKLRHFMLVFPLISGLIAAHITLIMKQHCSASFCHRWWVYCSFFFFCRSSDRGKDRYLRDQFWASIGCRHGKIFFSASNHMLCPEIIYVFLYYSTFSYPVSLSVSWSHSVVCS